MSQSERQSMPDQPVVRPRRQVIKPRYLDDFYVDYTMQRQPLHSHNEQPMPSATGRAFDKERVPAQNTESRPVPTQEMITGSSGRSSFVDAFQGSPPSQSQISPKPNEEQRISSTSPHTAARESRPVLPRDHNDLSQPIGALHVDSRRDPQHSHSVSHKEIDYLTDNLRGLRPLSSAAQLTPQPFFPHEPSHSQLRMNTMDMNRPCAYYNMDDRKSDYPRADERNYSQTPAAVRFMPRDFDSALPAHYSGYTEDSMHRRPGSCFPPTESQGYQQPYVHSATYPISQEERSMPRDIPFHPAGYDRHPGYDQSTPIHADIPVFPKLQPSAESTRTEPYQPYHLEHPHSSPYHHGEPSYRGPVPTIPNFCREDPREFARLKIALENVLPAEATERFKFQILVDHLKHENALLIADSYVNSRYPYTSTMRSLTALYGQPHQLALQRIAELMDGPTIKSGDIRSFRLFALKVRALVGMLDQLGAKGWTELKCGSHVSRLLAKLPHDLRANFRRFTNPIQIPIPTLLDLSDWLEYELRIQEDESQYTSTPNRTYSQPHREQQRNPKPAQRFATVLHGSEHIKPLKDVASKKEKPKKYCPFCNTVQHYFNQCANFKLLNQDQVECWLKSNQKCFKCGRDHRISECNLKAKCKKCDKIHLDILHDFHNKVKPDIPTSTENSCLVSSEVETLYLDRPVASSKVLLKVTRVILRNGEKELDTYAILDDGSERTMLLHAAAQQLGLQKVPEDIALRTVRQDIRIVHGAAVSFSITAVTQPDKVYTIEKAFTAKELNLAKHTYPVKLLQRKYRHLQGLPIPPLQQAQPLLLIGSDYPHLITAIEPVRLGPPGGPAAVKTRLGWTLQGPSKFLANQLSPKQCLFTSVMSPEAELFNNVQKLWQMDTLPYKSEKLITRSRQDAEAVKMLEEKTVRVTVGDCQRYATPLLWKKNLPPLQASKDAVTAHLRSTEKRLLQNTDLATVYNNEVQKLENAGYTSKLTPEEIEKSHGAWYIPHHIVHHNEKPRIVFNCSFKHKGTSLNDHLLPGPTLGPSLLGVLLRFRENAVAISSDVKGMFHQVRLLEEDKPFLRFLWRNLELERHPDIYEWQVLPFGTVCSPCCATFALQNHVFNYSKPAEDVRVSVEHNFYVDNWLQSFPSTAEAQTLVTKMQVLLSEGGFELRQWATNTPSVIAHLPDELKSANSHLWFTQSGEDPQEMTLGLRWQCSSDVLGYRSKQEDNSVITLRNIYKTLASQYDPLGFLIPFTTRAKIIVQRLWDKKREWDDPDIPKDLLQAWSTWQSELSQLPHITFPRCYTKPDMDLSGSKRTIHIFCDASERAYGSVAYLGTSDGNGETQVSFVAARSRVAPKRQQSIPRLELCAALTGAQLAATLRKELTIKIDQEVYWTDSTTVLTWLHSDSCTYKVFVGTRVAEIQDLTDPKAWRYVNSELNPADDITRGLALSKLIEQNRWNQGPQFLTQPASKWPKQPLDAACDDTQERRNSTFCGTLSSNQTNIPDISQYHSLQDLIKATAISLHGAADGSNELSVDDYSQAELELLRQAQIESFPEETAQLQLGKSLSHSSRLLTLAPEYDHKAKLIRVGGRLRRCDDLDSNTIHPIVMNPAHPLSKLLIQHYDNLLLHPGPERVFAEIRRKYWILRGREAVKRHQSKCFECKKWRGKPEIPRMADLPPSNLRLFRPAFYSTGIDCFGPFQVKFGRRCEKRWGILYKCLTTKAVHIELLSSLDSDSFLMSLRRFIARRGKPHEILSDHGTNFKGGNTELQNAFNALQPSLKEHLDSQQIHFRLNPPNAPHFGGSWERDVKSIKTALRTSLGSQSVPEEVLTTVLVEIEGILNSRPLGYVSSDVADIDPVTPNSLLMGRLSSALPQVVYPESEILSRKRWRHSQILIENFWKCFIRYYLPDLQQRQKWQKESENLQTDEVMMIVDQQSPRALWQVGTVTKVLPGQDGRVRSAIVKVKDKSYTRPVARLIKLPALPTNGNKD
nr:uncharacterized protein LOC129416681 [Misgurnus anguillicaudatus]